MNIVLQSSIDSDHKTTLFATGRVIPASGMEYIPFPGIYSFLAPQKKLNIIPCSENFSHCFD
jgi:hypothetical protein